VARSPRPGDRLFAVLGDPIDHSRSPAIMNGLLEARDIPASYLGMRLAPGHLAPVLEALHQLPFHGFNLTYPFKEEGAAAACELDPAAAALGAVNTLVRTDTGWRGLSTDGEGLLLWLREERDLDVRGLHLVVLGAGGAARSAIQAAHASQARVTAVTRSPARFQTPFFEALAGDRLETVLAGDEDAVGGALEAADLVVHATPYGLGEGGAGSPPPWPLERIGPEADVVDMNYRTEGPTPFLEALPSGPARADGRGMLAGQAVLAFEAWTGERPRVREALLCGGLL
jgi:shikimate dehydrogenase